MINPKIRQKGDWEEQGIYFADSVFAWHIADGEYGRVKIEQKGIALRTKVKGLILQNPKPEDLKKKKKK